MRLSEMIDLIADYGDTPDALYRRTGNNIDRDAAWQAIVAELERVYQKAGEA